MLIGGNQKFGVSAQSQPMTQSQRESFMQDILAALSSEIQFAVNHVVDPLNEQIGRTIQNQALVLQ